MTLNYECKSYDKFSYCASKVTHEDGPAIQHIFLQKGNNKPFELSKLEDAMFEVGALTENGIYRS